MTKYNCWDPNGGGTREDGEEIEAFDIEEAAKIFADQYWVSCAENPEEMEVAVCEENCTTGYTVFSVTPEFTVVYYATEKRVVVL